MTKDRLEQQAELREKYNNILKNGQETITANKNPNNAVEGIKRP